MNLDTLTPDGLRVLWAALMEMVACSTPSDSLTDAQWDIAESLLQDMDRKVNEVAT